MSGVQFPHALPIFRCLNCDIQIPLPSSMLPPEVEHQAWWPNGSDLLYVACSECRHISGYLRYEVIHEPAQKIRHADKAWLRISFRCAQAGCGIPVQFHVLMQPIVNANTHQELRAKLGTGFWKGGCPYEHPMPTNVDLESRYIRFEMAGERLQGYNPNHPMWREFA